MESTAPVNPGAPPPRLEGALRSGGSPGGRIIRPAGAAGALPASAPLELNLEEVQRFAERVVREARERVAGLEAEARELEAALTRRAAEGQEEVARKRVEAERELEEWKRSHFSDAEAASRAGFERGRAEGQAQGAAQGRQEGHRKGFEEGYGEGRQSGYREAQQAERERLARETAPLEATLEALLREIEVRRQAVRREAREELLPLAMEIAKKVVKREVRECPEVVLHNVQKAIDLAFRRTGLTVQVHPEDAALVERYAPRIFGAFAGLSGASVRPAEDVERGGCRVISGSGMVDLRIDAQLEVIEQALFERLGEEGPEEAGSREEVSSREERVEEVRA